MTSVRFGYGNSLSAIVVEEGNTSYSSIDGVLYNRRQTSLRAIPGEKTGEISIPSTVTTISVSAFRYGNSLSAINVDEGNANFTSIDGCFTTRR